MSQLMICPNCRTENPAENQFCFSCGARFGSSQPTPPPAPQPQTIYQTPPTPWADPSPAQPIQYQPSQASHLGTYPIDKLGFRLDGWASLIADAADKSEAVQSAFSAELQRRQMPHVSHPRTDLTPGGLMGKRRLYQLSQSYTGATMAAYIGAFGCDLFVVWDLYRRLIIKWRNIAIMAGAAAILAIFPAYNSSFGGNDFSFSIWFATFLGWSGLIGIGALILGAVLRGSRKVFFIEEIDAFAADDITAMMLAVHQSLQCAIVEARLDASLLRPKEHFTAGRKERII